MTDAFETPKVGATNPNDETEAVDNDMHPNKLDESPHSLEDDEYPDDDDYEEISENEA